MAHSRHARRTLARLAVWMTGYAVAVPTVVVGMGVAAAVVFARGGAVSWRIAATMAAMTRACAARLLL